MTLGCVEAQRLESSRVGGRALLMEVIRLRIQTVDVA
jgi:hypothetical protein